VMIAGHFRKALAGAVHHHRPIIDLASYRSLQDRCVNEGGVGMSVRRRRPPGWYSTSALILLPGTFRHVLVTSVTFDFIRYMGRTRAYARIGKRFRTEIRAALVRFSWRGTTDFTPRAISLLRALERLSQSSPRWCNTRIHAFNDV
jgi:hypothetical protein